MTLDTHVAHMSYYEPMDIAATTSEVWKLVAQLTAEERRRIFVAVTALCGDSAPEPAQSSSSGTPADELMELSLPSKAIRWLSQFKIGRERLEQVFHIEGRTIEIIVADMFGRSKREQTVNCYLLTGIQSLLSHGEPTVDDAAALALCKRYKCHDVANHASYRKQYSNYWAGDKERGFVLSAPGLKAAAELVRAN